ncbi:MAG: hypothetical protein K2N72_01295 [Oscillospiraceae bacterium]|nr:hypothetical protein [Oscillospiraceae bacterium]
MKNLKKKEFKRLLANGYGNALRFLNCCDDPMQYAKIIAECCTTDTCFDMQCEGHRGAYLCDAVMLTGQPEYFADIVMERLSRRHCDHWASFQMLELLVCIYYEETDISPKIRNFLQDMYIKEFARCTSKSFSKVPRTHFFEDLCNVLVDDIDSSYFERIVNDVGGYLLGHPNSDRFSLDWFFARCTDHGKKRSRLKKADKACAEIFMKRFDLDYREKHEPPPPPRPAFAELIAEPAGELSESENLQRTVNFRRAAHKADDEELLQLAKLTLSEKDEKEKYRMLCVFEKRPFPLGFEAVREMLESGSEKIKVKCAEAMGCFKEKEAEDFLRCNGFLAYVQCAKRLDVPFMTGYRPELPDKSGEKFDRADFFHILWHNTEGRQDCASRKYEQLRRYIYRNLNCTFCREYLVQLMVRSRDNCNDILRECRFDCNLDLRSYADRVLKRRQK